jgi:hypothetical protein
MQFSFAGPSGGFYSSDQLTAVSLARGGVSYALKNSVSNSSIWYNDGIPAGTNYTLTMNLAGQQISLPAVPIPAGGFVTVPLKYPPWVTLVAPSAASPPGALSVASGSCDFAAFLIPESMTRSSRNRLKAVVDLIFDALPDLIGAHARIFH